MSHWVRKSDLTALKACAMLLFVLAIGMAILVIHLSDKLAYIQQQVELLEKAGGEGR